MGKILPIILALIGLGAGLGAGIALRPDPEVATAENPCGDGSGAPVKVAAAADPEEEGEEGAPTSDFVKINNQFVVPVVKNGAVASLVVMALSVEVNLGQSQAIYQREPKLRDIFLQVMFDHANAGGFDGAFTAGPKMNVLRTALMEAASATVGENVLDVLITDIARQDL
ncbi:MAG: flagellar basal body-associated protein FliL [Maritimibacter sp.]